ncbi:MAG: uroporphyrinogen decarboxylase family protein, partial [Sedimentisphaerales bacterium]
FLSENSERPKSLRCFPEGRTSVFYPLKELRLFISSLLLRRLHMEKGFLMTPRERIMMTLNHKEPDRMAIDFAGTDCSSVHVIAYNKLRKHLKIEPRNIRLACLVQMVAECDDEIHEYFCSDAKPLYFYPRKWQIWDSGWGFSLESPDLWHPEALENGKTVIRDTKGAIRFERPAGGFYFDPVSFVFSEIQSPDELVKYPSVFERWDWSSVYDESIGEYAHRAKQLYLSTDRAVIASWRMHYLQAGQIMRGYEQFMIDLLTDEKLVRGMLDKLHETYLKRAKLFLDAMANYTDVVFFTDDLGTQSGPLIGIELYRKLIKPYWAELIALVKKYNKKVLMHSCGAISEFIPDMIEIGIDAVNPVQITADGMNPARLKKDFGKDITFWGGGVSTQGMLDKGTSDRIRDEVKSNIEIFAPGGGFVFTQVHNIQHDVPPQNIIAAYQTALEA